MLKFFEKHNVKIGRNHVSFTVRMNIYSIGKFGEKANRSWNYKINGIDGRLMVRSFPLGFNYNLAIIYVHNLHSKG